VPEPRTKAVWRAAMREWMVGMMTMSVGPKMGAERRLQVEKEGVLDARTRDSARA
jgi:hypothetical protein